ncbi:hypothetical protein MKEN_00746600 [Mycena kentingensis (nom. inval.)]|nr:hypothetical protein MKEN_00746600 [Mycena kentingensis (nom. inval.)]
MAIAFHHRVGPSGTYIVGVASDDAPIENRRHAVYFPDAPDDDAVELVDLSARPESEATATLSVWSGSSWEFTAPVATAFPAVAASPAPRSATPAQEVVFRYRAGLAIEIDQPAPKLAARRGGDGRAADWWDEGEDTAVNSECDAPAPATPTRARTRLGLGQILRPSKSKAKAEPEPKAEEPAVCPHCLMHLPNPKVLVFHMHLHTVDAQAYRCDDCFAPFSKRFELTMHKSTPSLCPGPGPRPAEGFPAPAPSILSAPTRGCAAIMRVLTRVTSH